ncbi:neutral/alkaline non-lysosomal ceramidase N-terminal domain-containing protein [Spongisporangium articulatum]|uniref:Neutral ceramidase n=1 Tax=Spongisporangium articulatum TaxID=3362603 RepID=A0ABW8ASY0_9ACTN
MEPLAVLGGTLDGDRLRLTLSPGQSPPLPDVPRLLAGAAEVDITPPPGLPKAGYSRNAKDGNGFRTRLRARVIHLRQGTTSLAIVATDLLGGSALIQHLVARRLLEAGVDVPLEGLLIGATHTHGAPGQFHGTDFYNRFSSNRPGLDPDWTAFLVERVTEAVQEAVATRRPAVAGWGRTRVEGLTRNRSLPAFRRNPGSSSMGAYDAVNPWVEVLRLDSAEGDPLAALLVFSIHGTTVPSSTGPYNADLWSYLCTDVGDRIATGRGARPVVAALQGTHGDVTPALEAPAGHAEAARIGRGVAARAMEAYTAAAPRETVDLGCALREVDLRDPAQRRAPGAPDVALPARPAVGAALVAGARENLTPGVSLLPFFRAGHGKPWSRSVHGAKWVLGSRWGQPAILPLDGFPRVLPLQLLRVGDVVLTGLPFEITTTSGRRFAEAIEAATGQRAVVTSVADEYVGYCTTAAEYSAQFYEGGHTLYGPATQRFLAACLESLGERLATGGGRVRDVVPHRVPDLKVRRYWPAPASGEGASSTDAPVVHAVGDVSWAWTGPAPAGLRWHEPLVRVERRAGDGWEAVPQPGGRVLDDGHGDLSVVVVTRQGYRVRWHAAEVGSVPAAELPGAAGAPAYRFVLLQGQNTAARPEEPDGPLVRSASF